VHQVGKKDYHFKIGSLTTFISRLLKVLVLLQEKCVEETSDTTENAD